MPTFATSIRTLVLAALCYSILTIAGCGGGEPDEPVSVQLPVAEKEVTPPADTEIVVTWSEGKIYLSEIDAIIQPARALETIELPEGTDPIDYIYQKRKQTIDTLLGNYLLIHEAKERGLVITDAEREQLLRDFKGQFRSQDEYLENLKKAGQSEAQLAQVLSNIALGQKCMEDQRRRVAESLTPERKEEFYNEEITMFTPPARSAFNRVVIQANEGRTLDEAKVMAKQLHKQAVEEMAAVESDEEKRRVIQDLAYAHSDTPEAQYNYGYCLIYHLPDSDNEFTQEFMQELRATPVNALSGVVQTASGYGFFLIKEKIDSFVQPFDSETVQSMLPNMMLQMELEAWNESLQEKYGVMIYEERLREWPADLPPPGN